MPLLSHPRPLRAGFIDPCLPTTARVPPSGAGWLHEIKHDGYRLIARLEGRGTRLFSRRGHDWTERFPRIRAALAVLGARSATIDGEAVVCCRKTGLSLFDRLHSGRHDGEVVLYAFDLIELNGLDLRTLPLEQRKAKLAALIAPLATRILLTSTSRRTALPCFVTPAGSAARGSSRNGAMRPTFRFMS